MPKKIVTAPKATIDQISDGRVTVHFITGGNDHEQAREGDRLPKDDRYSRTREYIEIVKRVWTEHAPFDHAGRHYAFEDFVSDVFPVQQPRPGVSFGGSSPAAYETGSAVADIYCLWGEPLADTAEHRPRTCLRGRCGSTRANPRAIRVARGGYGAPGGWFPGGATRYSETAAAYFV